jgi:hypothetical protein
MKIKAIIFYLVKIILMVLLFHLPEKLFWKILFPIIIISISWLKWEIDNAAEIP